MYKSIIIGERSIQLKASIFSQLIYKQAFGKDMLVQIKKVRKLSLKLMEMASKKIDDEADEADELIELSDNVKLEYYKFLWAFAKGADKSVPAFEDWLSELDLVAFAEVASTVNELISSMIRIDRKNA